MGGVESFLELSFKLFSLQPFGFSGIDCVACRCSASPLLILHVCFIIILACNTSISGTAVIVHPHSSVISELRGDISEDVEDE